RDGASREQTPLVPEQLDAFWSQAEQRKPTWRSITVRFPNRSGAPVAFTISDGASWNRFARSQLTLDAATGEVRQWQPYEAGSLGQKTRGWLRFAHTGELGGPVGQLIAGFGCVGGVFLVWTGLSLAVRRFLNWPLWSGRRMALTFPEATGAISDDGGVGRGIRRSRVDGLAGADERADRQRRSSF
ncbi:MAG TPA: PepSY-associated TM helix domain-containing protein, partial [Vicinamibacterales bacterium]